MVFVIALLSSALLTADPPGILVERRLASELQVGVGDTVLARGTTGDREAEAFVIEGIYERPADPNRISRNELEVRFHLPDLERLLDLDDRVDRFAIVLKPGSDERAATDWIEGLAFGTRVMGSAELSEGSSTTFEVVSRFQQAIGFITMLASGIFLLCLMVIRVDERRPDVRTLRLIGISRRTVFSAIVIETVLIATLAAFLGAGLGALMTVGVNAYYANFYDTTLRFALLDPSVIRTAIGTGIVLGIVTGAMAAFRVVRLHPQRLGGR